MRQEVEIVVDPDPNPVGSEIFAGSPDPENVIPDPSSSVSEQLRIRNEFEVKLLWTTGKIWQFLGKNAQLKI